MAESVVDPVVIKRTQEILGKFVKKPALTDKLLNKPPFRFLHDLVNAVIKETGFLDGLYTTSELNSENVKDRDAKIKFLQKLIDVIKLITNASVAARASKIVAGHEAEKTNQLLQLIGVAIEKKLDFKSAIESVKHGNVTKQKNNTKEKLQTKVGKIKSISKDTTAPKPDNRNEKQPTKSSNQIVKNEKNGGSKIESKTKQSKKEKEKAQVKKSSKESIVGAKPVETKVKPEIKAEKEKPTKRSTEVDEQQHVTGLPEMAITKLVEDDKAGPAVKKENSFVKQAELKDEPELPSAVEAPVLELSSNEVPNPDLNANIASHNNNINDLSDSGMNERKNSLEHRKKSIGEESSASLLADRPKGSSKRSRPIRDSAKQISKKSIEPEQLILKSSETTSQKDVTRQTTFVRENSQVDIGGRPRTSLRPPSVRPASARPGAPRRRDKNVEIILQPNDQIKVAGINVKVESFESQLEDDGENLVIIESIATHDGNADNIDHKVTIDEESQKGHLVQQILQTQKELTQMDSDFPIDIDSDTAMTRKRQSSARQMDSLRDVIQNLTRSINPLGKLMDFLPEDIDSMHLELTMWRDVYMQSASELKKEKSLTESAIEPMKNQLAQISFSIKEYTGMIDTSRAKILQNSEKIYKMLTER